LAVSRFVEPLSSYHLSASRMLTPSSLYIELAAHTLNGSKPLPARLGCMHVYVEGRATTRRKDLPSIWGSREGTYSAMRASGMLADSWQDTSDAVRMALAKTE